MPVSLSAPPREGGSDMSRRAIPEPTLAIEVPPYSWLDRRVKVERSGIHGLGLFATAPIRKGEVVEVLGGTTLTDSQVQAVIARGERYDGIALAHDYNLRIEPPDWPGVHGNHSCDPNLWMHDEVTVEARRDIHVGEELTTDYALYTIASWWSMPCTCSSRLCRRVVTGDDWQHPELIARYRGHFAPVVARRIALMA